MAKYVIGTVVFFCLAASLPFPVVLAVDGQMPFLLWTAALDPFLVPIIGGCLGVAGVCTALSLYRRTAERRRPEIEKLMHSFDNTYAFARDSLAAYRRKASTFRAVTVAYIIFMLAVIYTIILALCLFDNLFINLSGLIFYVPLVGITVAFARTEEIKLGSGYLPREKFPLLYDLLYACAHRAGVKGRFRIHLAPDCNIGINFANNYYNLTLGVHAAQMLSFDELSAVFMHEMAHIKHHDTHKVAGYNRLSRFFSDAMREKPKLLFYLNFALLYWIGAVYVTYYDLYNLCVSLNDEIAADALVRERAADRQNFINAAAKLRCYDEYTAGLDTYSFFAPEEPTAAYTADILKDFLRDYQTKRERWLTICRTALPDRRPTHPTLFERMAFMETDIGELTFLFPADPFREEMDAVCAEFDRRFYQEILPTYGAARKAEYLDMRDKAAAYLALSEAERDKLNSLDNAQYADAFSKVLDYDRALALYGRAIDELPENAFAAYGKGDILLAVYDDGGVPCIKAAIDKSNTYIEQGGELLLKYLQKMGRAREREETREWLTMRLQRAINQAFDYNRFKRGDRFLPHTLDKKQIKGLRETAARYGCIGGLYALKKLSKDGYSLHVLGVSFLPGFEADAQKAYAALFYHTDNTKGDYLLQILNGNKKLAAKLEKAGGGLLYRKQQITEAQKNE
ncbi:MAG: M48 family metalloprotease [Clostridiales bacterium]|jgi:Zn-dependent protease with chaperone function|nr:M48 family metalloprotease [Clostridiales bacterium]